ncbi:MULTISPECIES: DUF402 domain-containing protein [Streptomyces]|uniref:DUF402 domain-containing protein n=1 Tax=Streptomyces glycanivorans TaxID=3033808 RepID=A0ABY9JQ38_9ACTN|nr:MULTISPECIES: DUF402 domain-containing protein [unclassified Streptomyces]WLQ68112.1 DUF402 domain-containing protein [Streptomyces sp. Alt3]WSR05201.1 YgaC family protein [Streptomyces sp. NBC_01208]
MTTERASVLVEVRKYDGRLSGRWTAARLGEDEHGVWLGTPQGAPTTSDSGDWAARFAHVVLVPRDAWWMASFCAAPGPEVYCDVCTVPRWSEHGTVLRLVDLDLDVVRPHGGDVHVEDEDEFAEHRVRHGYPDSVVTHARQTCAWLTGAVRRDDGAEPFTSAYRPWLALIA